MHFYAAIFFKSCSHRGTSRDGYSAMLRNHLRYIDYYGTWLMGIHATLCPSVNDALYIPTLPT